LHVQRGIFIVPITPGFVNEAAEAVVGQFEKAKNAAVTALVYIA
jgi:hypothetical protein